MEPVKITPVRRSKAGLVGLAFIAFISLGLPDGLLGVAWPSIRAQFGLPLDAMGLLLLVSAAGIFVASLTAGRLVERLGLLRLMILSSLISALSLVGHAAAPSWGLLIVAGFFAGFGGGLQIGQG